VGGEHPSFTGRRLTDFSQRPTVRTSLKDDNASLNGRVHERILFSESTAISGKPVREEAGSKTLYTVVGRDEKKSEIPYGWGAFRTGAKVGKKKKV